jgi:autotransporter-associated beta strand protein
MKPKSTLRNFLALAGSSLLAANSASAQVDGNWSSNLTGNWSNPLRWSSNPDIPGGAGSIVGINSDITVNNLAVTIDTTSRTVGSLTIGDSNNSHGFLLSASGGASLIFDNNGSGATLTETGSVTDTISAPITLADNLGVNSAGLLSLTGAISETGGVRSLTKTGGGGLYLANTSNNFSGGVFLNAGTLYTGSNSAAFGTGRLTINGGRIDIATSSGSAGTTVTTTNANTWNASWSMGRGSTGDATWNNNGDILLGATVAVTSANNNTFLNLGGVISDGGNNYGVSFGSNRTTLSNANTFTGLTTLSAGTLRLSHANALSNSSGVRLTTGTLDLTTNSTIKALTLVGAGSTVTGSFNLDFSSGGTILHEDSTGNRAGSITSGITGSPTVTVTAGETLTLNPGSLTQTLGALALNPRVSGQNDNILSLDGTSTGNSTGNITQTTTSNGQRSALVKSGTGTWTVGNLAGVGQSRLRVLPNAGRLIVTGDIYGVQLEMGAGGTLELQKAGNLFTTTGSSTNVITNLRSTIENSSGSLITFASNPAITFSGDFTHAGNSINMGTGATVLGANRQVTVSNAASTLTFGGVISGVNFGLTKLGNGTMALSNANTYSGTTIVTAGKLLVNNTTGSGTGSGAVMVSNGGTLGGSGIISGNVTTQNGGTFAAGTSIESLATGSLTQEAGSTFAYEANNNVATAVAGDLTAVTGNLTFDLTNAAILTLTELGTGSWAATEKLTLISYTGVWNGGLFEYLGNAVADDSNIVFSGYNWTFNYNDTGAGANFTSDLTGGSFVTMTAVSAIPEPSAALLGGLGLLALLRRRR